MIWSSARAFTLMLGLCLSAGAAFAEACTFTLECFEGEECSATEFSMQVEGGQIITDAETFSVTRGGSTEVAVYVGVTDSAFHLLTHDSVTGSARYSTHIFDGPLMVNYLGLCGA